MSIFFITYIVYIIVAILIFYWVYTWVNRYLKLKQEQNDILRELVNKMERK